MTIALDAMPNGVAQKRQGIHDDFASWIDDQTSNARRSLLPMTTLWPMLMSCTGVCTLTENINDFRSMSCGCKGFYPADECRSGRSHVSEYGFQQSHE